MGRREVFPGNAGAVVPTVVPRLSLSTLLAMVMSGFVAILSKTLPTGLLPQIGAGLAVGEVLVGQLVSVYALGLLPAALPAVSLTQGWRRRRVLLLALLIFLVCNSFTTVSSDYRLALLARFGSGVAAGLAWSLLVGYARRPVSPEQQGRALAVAMFGAPLALPFGVPLNTWLGDLLGWHQAFGLLSLITLLLAGWVLHSVPNFPGQPARRRLRLLGVLRTPGVRLVLLTIVTWVLAHNILYTYITPSLTKIGLNASVDLALLVFGGAVVVGIRLVGTLVDRHLRRMVPVSLALFAAVALALCLDARQSWLAFADPAFWGLAFGGATTLLQTASADAAGEGANLVQPMIVVAWNLAIAGDEVLDGMVLQHWDSEMLPWTLLPLVGPAAALARGNAAHAFRVDLRGFPRVSSERQKTTEQRDSVGQDKKRDGSQDVYSLGLFGQVRFEYPSRRSTCHDDTLLRHAAESAVIVSSVLAVLPVAAVQCPTQLLHRHLVSAPALPRINPSHTYPRSAYRSYRHDECHADADEHERHHVDDARDGHAGDDGEHAMRSDGRRHAAQDDVGGGHGHGPVPQQRRDDSDDDESRHAHDDAARQPGDDGHVPGLHGDDVGDGCGDGYANDGHGSDKVHDGVLHAGRRPALQDDADAGHGHKDAQELLHVDGEDGGVRHVGDDKL